MQRLRNYEGLDVRLAEERLAHILEHPEMRGLEGAISETVVTPETVVESTSDPQVRLYYRLYAGTSVGEKYLRVVVKETTQDAFAITAYLTVAVKQGKVLWPRRM